MFKNYHYLNHTHHLAAKQYVCTVNGNIAGFCSVIHFPHPKSRNIKKIHRLVVLPQYQGVSIGLLFLSEVAGILKRKGFRVLISSSLPQLKNGLIKSFEWGLIRQGRVSKEGKSSKCKDIVSSTARLTYTFEFTPQNTVKTP